MDLSHFHLAHFKQFDSFHCPDLTFAISSIQISIFFFAFEQKKNPEKTPVNIICTLVLAVKKPLCYCVHFVEYSLQGNRQNSLLCFESPKKLAAIR